MTETLIARHGQVIVSYTPEWDRIDALDLAAGEESGDE
jgi:hypothetical protein